MLQPDLAAKLNLAAWVPIDHEPPIPPVTNFFRESGSVPIAMSRFGEEQLSEFDPLYVPHGVDTEVYYPRDKAAIRKEVGVPDNAFLIGMIAANKGAPSRKGFQPAFQAFRVFREKHPEALLYLHTVADPRAAAGEDLKAMAAALGILESVVFAPPYRMMFDPYPPDSMAQLYSALDVLLNPAQGEGFGIPVLEAAACGVPAIVTNFSAMPEVAGPAGWHVGCRPFWTNGKSWQAVADIPEIIDALEQCYGQSDEERQKRSEAVRAHALEYDVKRVMDEYWLPVLEAVQERFGDRKPEVIRTDLAAA